MDVLTAILGTILLIATTVDVLWTTMGMAGGPISNRLSYTMHSGLMKVYRRFGSRGILVSTGIIVMISVIMLWVVMLWGGWMLIFNGPAIVNAKTDLPADAWESIYFTGFTLFTLGMGDYHATGPVWQVLTAICSLMGLFMITFSVTYLVPVVQAATLKRRLSVSISSLGICGEDIVMNTWNGKNLSVLGQHLLQMSSDLAQMEQQHLTYPMLHYFHGMRASESLALAVSALDEALNIVKFAVPPESGLPAGIYLPSRQIVTQFLYTIKETFYFKMDAGPAPPTPSLDALRKKGIPVVSNADFNAALSDLKTRRTLLQAFVFHEGWQWQTVKQDRSVYYPDDSIT